MFIPSPTDWIVVTMPLIVALTLDAALWVVRGHEHESKGVFAGGVETEDARLESEVGVSLSS